MFFLNKNASYRALRFIFAFANISYGLCDFGQIEKIEGEEGFNSATIG